MFKRFIHSVYTLLILYLHSVNETLPPVTEVLLLGQYYLIDCITGPVSTGVSVSWILTNGSTYSNNNTLVISSILPFHNNSHYTCIIKVVNNPTNCIAQVEAIITLRVKSNEFHHFLNP